MSEHEPFEVQGHSISLSDDRRVWAGKHEDSWYISFHNADVETKIRISFEAADALMKLFTADHTQVWRYILKITDEKTEWVEADKEALALTQADSNNERKAHGDL